MHVLVSGSSGHLGDAVLQLLPGAGHEGTGLDLKPGRRTDIVASVTDRAALRSALAGADAVIHAATLHKPHVASHARQDFVDTNVSGTLALLEEAARAGVRAFVFSSTTSAFGAALEPAPGDPAAWIDEDVVPVPRNIYGVTKTAAEDLCRLAARRDGLPVVVLRLARFFPEADDDAAARAAYSDANLKVTEFLHRRVDLSDAASAHVAALARAGELGFARLIVSATTPFRREDAAALVRDPAAVLRARVPGAAEAYDALGWRLPDRIGRVYDNARARAALGWTPRWGFADALAAARSGESPLSPLARRVGAKGYHDQPFAGMPYPVEPDPPA